MELQTILDQLEGKQILIIGDVILDEYICGDIKRISPEAPVPVLEVTSQTVRLGGAANVAHNVVGLGGKASLIGIVGDDRQGATLMNLLNQEKIDTTGVYVDKSRPTTTKTRLVAQIPEASLSACQQLIRVDRETGQPISVYLQKQLLEAVSDHIPQADAVVFEDYNKGVLTETLIQAVIDEARHFCIPVVVDPKAKNFWSYKNVTVVTPNHKEASTATNCKITNEASLLEIGETILERLNIQYLLITRGAEGMSLFCKGENGEPPRVDSIPAHPCKVFDGTGAGDTVVAVLCLALAAKIDILDAARLSNVAGGIAVGEVGCFTATREKLARAIHLEEKKRFTDSGLGS